MKKTNFIITILLISLNSFGQILHVNSKRVAPKKKGFDKSKIVTGGGLVLNFGTITNISASPILGYRLTDNFAAGVGLGFQYLRIANYNTINTTSYPASRSTVFPSIWANYKVYRSIVLQTKLEYLFQTEKIYGYDYYGNTVVYKNPYNCPAWLVGAAYRQPISNRIAINVSLMYDVLQNKNSPYYGIPVYGVGAVVGF